MQHLWGRGCLSEVKGSLGVGGSLWSPYAQALPNPGLWKLLQLVQHRDAFVRAQIQRHQACPSPPVDTVLGVLLGRNSGAQGGPLSPPRLHMALVDLFIGGTETTAAALGWAVAFLLHRPEVKRMSLHVFHAALEGPVSPPIPYIFSICPLCSLLHKLPAALPPGDMCSTMCPLYGPKAPCMSLGSHIPTCVLHVPHVLLPMADTMPLYHPEVPHACQSCVQIPMRVPGRDSCPCICSPGGSHIPYPCPMHPL
ncbi:hypothetical protein Nmel_018483 [Mimus melanotis]